MVSTRYISDIHQQREMLSQTSWPRPVWKGPISKRQCDGGRRGPLCLRYNTENVDVTTPTQVGAWWHRHWRLQAQKHAVNIK